MKKIVIFITLFTLLPLLFSCAGLPAANDALSVFDLPYTCEAAINDGDGIYTAKFENTKDALIMKLTEPALLCGTEYVCQSGGVSVVYNDIIIPLGDYANGKISRGVCVWADMLNPDGLDTYHVSADNGKGQYVITDGKTEYRIDTKTNAPVMIKHGDITITITNFRLQNDKSSEGEGADIKSRT